MQVLPRLARGTWWQVRCLMQVMLVGGMVGLSRERGEQNSFLRSLTVVNWPPVSERCHMVRPAARCRVAFVEAQMKSLVLGSWWFVRSWIRTRCCIIF